MALACPMPARLDPEAPQELVEVEALWPAYRRTVGDAALDETRAAVSDAVRAVIRMTGPEQAANSDVGSAEDITLRIRRYYERAALSLSPDVLGAHEFEEWFYGTTEVGRLIRRCQAALASAGRPPSEWRHLAPRAFTDVG